MARYYIKFVYLFFEAMLRHVEKILVPRNAELLFKSAYDWRFVFVYAATVENPNRGFYMCKLHFKNG